MAGENVIFVKRLRWIKWGLLLQETMITVPGGAGTGAGTSTWATTGVATGAGAAGVVPSAITIFSAYQGSRNKCMHVQ